MNPTSERVMPHNLDAERSVLGAVLVTSGQAFDVVGDQLRADQFFRQAHQRIYAAMTKLYSRQEAIDFVTLKEELAHSGHLEDIGGPAYIAGLADGVPRATNIEHYARIVRQKDAARQVIHTATRLLSRAYEEDDEPAALIDQVEQALLAISSRIVPGDLKSAEQMAREIYPVIEELTQTRRPIAGLSSGLPSLDRFTRGFTGGNLYVLAGRPSTGKSSLALQVALDVAKQDTSAFFSVEMGQQEQVFRVLTMLARVDGHHLQSGMLSMYDQEQVGLALVDFGNRRFWLDDTGTISPLQIRSRARRLKARAGLSLIVVDYLQLLNHGRADSREQGIANTTRTLKQVARELGVPIIVLSQLSRKVEERTDKRPTLADLRESGAIEQDADVVLLIYRPPAKSNGVVIETPPTELIIAKQRNGPTGSVELAWIGEQYRFGELERRQS